MAIFGIVFVVLGLVIVVWPGEVARLDEVFDAIGSKTPASEVEPADWKVVVTRFMGGFVTLFGVLVLVGE